LFARRPRNKQRSQELASTWSRFPIDSTSPKVSIRNNKKRKGRGRQVPKTELGRVSKVPEDPLGGLPMWSPRATPENERTDTQKTGCPASSPSSTSGSRSFSYTPSGPLALRPRPHRAL
jgi:hypothetical protein